MRRQVFFLLDVEGKWPSRSVECEGEDKAKTLVLFYHSNGNVEFNALRAPEISILLFIKIHYGRYCFIQAPGTE